MDDAEGGATIYVRLRDGRSLDSTSSTGYAVNPLWWDAKREEIKANVVCDNEEKAELNVRLQDLKKYLYSKYKTDKEKGKVNKEWLAKALKDFAKQQGKLIDQANDRSNSFQERFQEFLNANDFSEGRVNQYRVIERAVLRFEEFVRVTKLDSVTRTESKVPINEMASSHMARRTFIGNIYKLVKDPNLVSALTGHVEGSRAFNRYRTIDIDMKKDLVKILEGKQ